jgi:hypothetical protein
MSNMKSLVQSKTDKIFLVLQLIVVGGVLISGVIDPSFWIFGSAFTFPLSLIFMLYFLVRFLVLRSKTPMSIIKSAIISTLWVILSVVFILLVLNNFNENFMSLS